MEFNPDQKKSTWLDAIKRRKSIISRVALISLALNFVSKPEAQAQNTHENSNSLPQTHADSLLIHFNKIDSTNNYRTYLEPGSNKIFVSFPQSHRLTLDQLEGASDENKIALLNKTIQSQKNVYLTYKKLLEIFPEVNTLYPEGYIDERDVGFIDKMKADKDMLLYSFAEEIAKYFPEDHELNYAYKNFFNRTQENENNIGNNPKLILESYYEKYKFILGADIQLSMDGVIIKPSEDAESFESAWKAFIESNYDIEDAAFVLYQQKRESSVIEKVSLAKETIVPVVFGAWHDFLSEIQDWNKKNPNNKFSYIVIQK